MIQSRTEGFSSTGSCGAGVGACSAGVGGGSAAGAGVAARAVSRGRGFGRRRSRRGSRLSGLPELLLKLGELSILHLDHATLFVELVLKLLNFVAQLLSLCSSGSGLSRCALAAFSRRNKFQSVT